MTAAHRTWRWAPHKSISIQFDLYPSGIPVLDVCGQGDMDLERLIAIAAQFNEAVELARLLCNGFEPDGSPRPVGDD